jgi:hypothetical protein
VFFCGGKNMDYKERIQEGARMATYQAQKTALTNCVYVCTNKEKKLFEFIPLEEVVLFPNTDNEMKLSDYLMGLQSSIKGLSQDIQTLNGNNIVLQEAVSKLSEFVDNQRFL